MEANLPNTPDPVKILGHIFGLECILEARGGLGNLNSTQPKPLQAVAYPARRSTDRQPANCSK